MMLGLISNWLAAGLLAFTIFFYAVIYSMWLKRSTPQNIVIGGAAGALPPDRRPGGRHRACRLGKRHPLRHHLHLDAAAFLGPGAREVRAITRVPASR